MTTTTIIILLSIACIVLFTITTIFFGMMREYDGTIKFMEKEIERLEEELNED